MKLKESTFSRRSFLNGFLTFGFLGLVGSIFYPIKKFLLKGMEYKDPPSWLVPKDEVMQGIESAGFYIFLYGRKEAIVFRDPNSGKLKSFIAICTHAYCTVRYVPTEKYIHCACHNGYYDLDGKVIKGPPPRPLTTLHNVEETNTGNIVFSIQPLEQLQDNLEME